VIFHGLMMLRQEDGPESLCVGAAKHDRDQPVWWVTGDDRVGGRHHGENRSSSQPVRNGLRPLSLHYRMYSSIISL
jgi:hypothetical protein